MTEALDTAKIWSDYLQSVGEWESLVEGVQPKVGGCGIVYELPNPIDRPNESFAIADMRDLDLAQPHKHIDETEIYIVLRGAGKIAVGQDIRTLYRGERVVTPPDTVHITKPHKGLVMAVINTPPFNAENYVAVDPREQTVIDAVERLSS